MAHTNTGHTHTPTMATAGQAGSSPDGAVELLDLLPQPARLLLHLLPVLLQLAQVLHRPLQRGGVGDLRGQNRATGVSYGLQGLAAQRLLAVPPCCPPGDMVPFGHRGWGHLASQKRQGASDFF